MRVPAFVVDFSEDQRFLGKRKGSEPRYYMPLTHVTDWFPTLLSFAMPAVPSSHWTSIDGIDFSKALPTATSLAKSAGDKKREGPRNEMLLESYYADNSIWREVRSFRLSPPHSPGFCFSFPLTIFVLFALSITADACRLPHWRLQVYSGGDKR